MATSRPRRLCGKGARMKTELNVNEQESVIGKGKHFIDYLFLSCVFCQSFCIYTHQTFTITVYKL